MTNKKEDTQGIEVLIDFYEKQNKKQTSPKKRFPFKENLEVMFPEIKEMPLKEYNKLLYKKKITDLTKDFSSKSKKIFKEKFKQSRKNLELFSDFLLLNIKKDYKSEKFQEVWKKIQEIIIDIENSLLNNMENWKFNKFSSSTKERFDDFVKTFFPFYNNIWVKIKYAKNNTHKL